MDALTNNPAQPETAAGTGSLPDTGGQAPASPSAAGDSLPGASPAPADGASLAAQDWRNSLPESWREHFRNVPDAGTALKIVERGLRYQPALRPEDIVLHMPEGTTARPDTGVQDHFRRFCVEQGITPRQAQALLEWQLQTDAACRSRLLEEGTRTLQQRWGSRFEEKRGQALTAFMALDRRMGGELSRSPGGQRMASDPVMVQVFQEIGALLSEDSLAGGSGQAPGLRESAEDTYSHMFKE